MKINAITAYKSGKIHFKSSRTDYSRLSGQDEINNYLDKSAMDADNNDNKNAEVQNIIYNSLESLAALGKYESFKLLFKEIEHEEELKQDYSLYNTAGNVYKKGNDIKKAAELYEVAYQNANPQDSVNYQTIEKNYLETLIQQNVDVEKHLETIKKRNIPLSTVNYLELDSLRSLKNKNTDKAKNEILSAYSIAKNNGIISDDLYYKAALVMTSNSEIEKSTEICKTRLDALKRDNKIYTLEFLNYLTLLGINNFNAAQDPESLTKAKNTLQNAAEIEKNVPNPVMKEAINYHLLKIGLKNPSLNILKETADFVNECKNENFKKDICKLAAEFALKEDKETAKYYFDTIENILNKDKNKNKQELHNLYIKLKNIFPEQNYDAKLAELPYINNSPLDILILKLQKEQNSGNLNQFQDTLNNIINNPQTSKQEKGIAQTYQLFIRLNKGLEFYKTAEKLEKNLDELNRSYNEKNSDNNILAQHLFDSYKKLSDIQYNASNYYKAAKIYSKTAKFIDKLDISNDEKAKIKAHSTLLWYKQKNYYEAENSCIEFLKLITDIKPDSDIKYISTEELMNNKTEEQNRKIAATIETLGIINLKNKNYSDARKYYEKAIEIRNKLMSKDLYLANDYSALARIAILGYEIFGNNNLSSKSLHNKCLEILKDKYRNEPIVKEEEDFHKKYYGVSLTSFGKFIPFRKNESAMIEKFKCYNRELNICE